MLGPDALLAAGAPPRLGCRSGSVCSCIWIPCSLFSSSSFRVCSCRYLSADSPPSLAAVPPRWGAAVASDVPRSAPAVAVGVPPLADTSAAGVPSLVGAVAAGARSAGLLGTLDTSSREPDVVTASPVSLVPGMAKARTVVWVSRHSLAPAQQPSVSRKQRGADRPRSSPGPVVRTTTRPHAARRAIELVTVWRLMPSFRARAESETSTATRPWFSREASPVPIIQCSADPSSTRAWRTRKNSTAKSVPRVRAGSDWHKRGRVHTVRGRSRKFRLTLRQCPGRGRLPGEYGQVWGEVHHCLLCNPGGQPALLVTLPHAGGERVVALDREQGVGPQVAQPLHGASLRTALVCPEASTHVLRCERPDIRKEPQLVPSRGESASQRVSEMARPSPG